MPGSGRLLHRLKSKKKGGNIALAQLKRREKTSHYYIHTFVALNQCKVHSVANYTKTENKPNNCGETDVSFSGFLLLKKSSSKEKVSNCRSYEKFKQRLVCCLLCDKR